MVKITGKNTEQYISGFARQEILVKEHFKKYGYPLSRNLIREHLLDTIKLIQKIKEENKLSAEEKTYLRYILTQKFNAWIDQLPEEDKKKCQKI